jgi:DNA primase large subunit
MSLVLELRDYARYPFLKESQQFIAQYADSLEGFLQTNTGKIALARGVERVRSAIQARHTGEGGEEETPSDHLGVKLSVSGYALARVIVSCLRDRALTDRLTRYEAQRAFSFLQGEEPGKRRIIAEELGIDLAAGSVPVVGYVEMVSGLQEERWRLVNRELDAGRVVVKEAEKNELMRERIRVGLQRQLPLGVPEQICSLLAPALASITSAHQASVLEQFGTIDEGRFPPCINALIGALTGGRNIPHTGRFALTAFLHTIGMDKNAIVELYCRAPDFDVGKTLYQVEHITGRGGTEYTAPSCAAMRTTGLCVNKDARCTRVKHPLHYYRIRKKEVEDAPGEKKGAEDIAGEKRGVDEIR